MSVSSVSVKVRLGFTLALIVLGLSGLGSYYSVTAVAEIAGSARHSHRVIAALYGLQDAIKSAEAAQHDFAASRDKRRLDEAAAAHDEALRHLATLNNQPVVKPNLERRVDELDRLVRERLAELKALAAAAAPRPPSPPREDRPLKPLIMSLIADEVHALEDREAEANDIASRLSLIIGAACILTVMIALVSLLLVNKDVAARQEAEMALQEARMNLEVRVNERTLELARANAELRQEIAERQRAQVELQKARAQLEERVRDRTAELGRANTDLRQEIRQRTEAVRALRETTVLQRAILDSANYVIISTEPDGIIRTFNAAAQRMLGYREGELVGKQSVSLFHDPAELARRQAELSRELGMPIDSGFEVLVTRARLGTPDEREWTYVRKDGSRFPVLLSVTALRDEVEHVSGFLVIASDIAERKRYEEELRRAKEVAEAANRTKSEFLANMSHELRTPLNSVIGFTNILLKNKTGNLREQDLVFLQRVLDNGKHLLDLINQILDLSKIEAGRMELVLSTVALPDLVRQTLAQMEGQVRDKDVRLLVEVPPRLEPLRTDAGKLKQVLINLVGNAIKFTEHGSVTVRVEAEGDGRPVALEVRDTGIGIPADKLDAIFEAFQQADVSTTRKYGGTGLGLTIARSLCKLMGYEISVTSRVGLGSAFRVELRAGRHREEADAPTPRLRPTGEIFPVHLAAALPDSLGPCLEQGKNVLVIDDDSDSRLLLTQYIEDCGCRVVAVGSGPEGLHFATQFRPDLIVLDLMMPGMSGWEVLKLLKGHPDLCQVPVVVVSVIAGENRGTLLGAVDLLDKPVSREALGEMLRRNLQRRRGGRPRALLVEDNEDIRCLLSTYLIEEGLEVREARHGGEALALVPVFRPDLVILDLMMPVMDGLAFLDALRHDPRTLHLPVIVVTAKELTPTELQQLGGEAAAVLRKGDDLSEALKRVVRRLLCPEATSGERPAPRLGEESTTDRSAGQGSSAEPPRPRETPLM